MVTKKRPSSGVSFGLVILIAMFVVLVLNACIVLFVEQYRIDHGYIDAIKDEITNIIIDINELDDAEKAVGQGRTAFLVEVINLDNREVYYTNYAPRQGKSVPPDISMETYIDEPLGNHSYTVVEETDQFYNKLNAIGFNIPSSIIAVRKIQGSYFVLVQSEIISSLYAAKATKNTTYFALVVMIGISILFAVIISKIYKKSNRAIIEAAEKIAARDFIKMHPFKIKEHNQLANSLNHISREMQSYDISQQTFISDASHELKTPLSIISTYAEGIKYGLVNDELETMQYCDIILDECNRMNNIILDMISLVKAGMIAPQRSKTDINIKKYIDEELERYKGKYREDDIKTYLTGPPAIVQVNIEDLEKILTNYLSNAYKYCISNGEVVVSIKKEKKYAVVSVYNDCEAPIPEDELDRVWDRFYKSDIARTRKESSTGIGLAIVKTIAEKHGYPYGVSNIDKGVEFWVAFPLSPP